MKRQINLMWLIGLLLVALTASGQNEQAAPKTRTNPMKKADVVKALESNAISSKELKERIVQRGVDFELNEKSEQELKDAGAGAEVIDAVGSNYVAPQKRGLFGKMTDGLSKATGKAKESVEKAPLGAVAPLLLPPPVAVAVIAAQQVKKQKDAKANAPEKTAGEESTAPLEKAAPEAKANQTAPPEKTAAPKPAADALKPSMVGGFPKLVGTGWKILDIRNKGDQPKGGRTVVPTFVFCKSGRWEIVRYGLAPGNAGAVGQIGTYTVAGGTLTTKNNTDGLIAKYKMTWLAGENILELEEGNIIMRLEYSGETAC